MTVDQAPNLAILRHDPPVKMIPPFQKVGDQTFWLIGFFPEWRRTEITSIRPECPVTVVAKLSKELPML